MLSRAATLWMLATAGACAADPPQPPAAVGPSSFFGLLQVVLALLLVLGAIVAFAWFVRRLGPGRGAAGGLLKVVGGVMVGPKERLVVVEVADTWLIVGVGASSVNLLHSMPRPATADVPTEQSFASLIGQARKPRTPEA
jgi:flagellar protein FliO/FliZ